MDETTITYTPLLNIIGFTRQENDFYTYYQKKSLNNIEYLIKYQLKINYNKVTLNVNVGTNYQMFDFSEENVINFLQSEFKYILRNKKINELLNL